MMQLNKIHTSSPRSVSKGAVPIKPSCVTSKWRCVAIKLFIQEVLMELLSFDVSPAFSCSEWIQCFLGSLFRYPEIYPLEYIA
jgi:hypothetical protein